MKVVLLIEDNADMRHNIATILRMENYDVVACADGHAGLEKARDRAPDIILCDVTMPKLDGYGVLSALRNERALASIPFIFLTARDDKRDVRAGMNLGADDYLTKPVAGSDLLNAIKTRLTRSEMLAPRAFKPDFASAVPLEKLGLTSREAEVLLWVTQGKSNADIATILAIAVPTVKKHLQNVFEKLGVETRNGASFRALEVLSGAAGGEE